MNNQRILIVSAGTPILFNRDAIGRDGWIHIVPRGELSNSEAGVVQVLDDRALDSIIKNFKGDSERLGDRWPGVYGGEEHFIYNSDKSSEAFMWAKEFEKRGDGIWARGDVTDVGEPAIRNKRFKFTSFVTDPQIPGSVEKLDGNRVRILRVDTFGFTNFANGRHLLTPITNRETLPDNPATPNAGEQAAIQNRKKQTMKTIAAKLGLSADASEDAILGEVTKLMNRASEAEGKITPLTTENTTLKNRAVDLEKEQIESLLDGAGIKDDATRGKLAPVLAPMKNREERADFLKLVSKSGDTTTRPLTNRSGAKTPDAKVMEDEDQEEAEKKKAQKIKNRAEELRGASPARSFGACWAQARTEVESSK